MIKLPHYLNNFRELRLIEYIAFLKKRKMRVTFESISKECKFISPELWDDILALNPELSK